MAKKDEVYKCLICGNVVRLMHGGVGQLICCGQPMHLLKENTEDASEEKHVPIIEKTDKGIKVKIGSQPHPMEEKHCIEWIEVIADGRTHIKFLEPGNPPEAEFWIKSYEIVRAYCNLHGMWKA